MERLQRSIHFAQNEAFRLQKSITLCGSYNQKTCHALEDWSNGFLVLIQEMDQNHEIKSIQILQQYPALKYGHLKTTIPGHVFHVQANGLTMNMGSFIYSPRKSRDAFLETILVINRGCRSYLMRL